MSRTIYIIDILPPGSAGRVVFLAVWPGYASLLQSFQRLSFLDSVFKFCFIPCFLCPLFCAHTHLLCCAWSVVLFVGVFLWIGHCLDMAKTRKIGIGTDLEILERGGCSPQP